MKWLPLVIVLICLFLLTALNLSLSWQEFLIATITFILFTQGVFFSVGMLYAWKDSSSLAKITPPRLIFGKPKKKFSLLIPARFEEKVIRQTLFACSRIRYPKDQFEVIVICRNDDTATINEVVTAIKQSQNTDIKLVTFDGFPINKPKALNIGLIEANYPYVGVFDAEDEPNPELLSTIDCFLGENPGCDIVQSGIQLVNVNSSWFSPLACLEYYFWFRSVLPLFAYLGSTPLGGNTIFFKKNALNFVGGWDETCLTEDAEIGTRLAAKGFNIRVIYDNRIATLEETPACVDAFIKQRTRWIQGYIQTIKKGHWAAQNSPKKRFMSLYLLLQPVIHELLAFAFVLGPIAALSIKVPLVLTMISFLPAYFLLLQLGVTIIGLKELSRNYNLKTPKLTYFSIILFYFPYQFLISIAFLRAVKRQITQDFGWEKTEHSGLHRHPEYKLNFSTV